MGDYACGSAGGSQTPTHGAYVAVIFPSAGYSPLAGTCTVHVTSAGPTSAAGWRITGTITGHLVDEQDAPFPVSGSFDVPYQN